MPGGPVVNVEGCGGGDAAAGLGGVYIRRTWRIQIDESAGFGWLMVTGGDGKEDASATVVAEGYGPVIVRSVGTSVRERETRK